MPYCSQTGLSKWYVAGVLHYVGLLKATPEGNGTWIPSSKLESYPGHVLPEELLMLPGYRTGGVGPFK